MRLRLRVQRNELPAINTLWPLTDVQQKHTIAQLLEAINQTFPLETDKWGLEDYVVTVASYECLHYHEIGAVCKDEDEVVVRPLTYAEVRARTLMGRSQISGDGRKLEDGIAFGRPLLRAPVRPEVKIPARKRKRGSEDEDDGDKRVRFITNGGANAQVPGEALGNHKTVVVVSGRDDEDEEDDDEEDDEDFEAEDDASSSEAESESSESSEASSSSSDSDSSDSTASSDSSDSSSDSSSDESSESSVKASKSRRGKTISSHKAPNVAPSIVPAKSIASTTNKTQQTTSGAPQQRALPHEGKKKTQERNARRRDSKKLAYLKENNILPPSADLTTLRAWEQSADWTTAAPGLTKHMNATETSSSTLAGGDSNSTEDLNEELDLATRRQQLLNSIASGGVEIGVSGKAIQDEDEEGPEVQSNKVAAKNAALTEHLYRQNIDSMANEEAASQAASSRRGLDMSSAQRLLYGSLGVRTPKTQEQKDALQKRLADRQGTAAPKSKSKAQSKQPEVVADEVEEDTEAWMQRIDLRAVECCDEGVELSTPPFPFYQRWDPQYRKKKNRNLATYANPPRNKRRRGNQGNVVGEFVESYDKYNQDGYGDALDYDGDGGDDADWDQDDLAEQQLLNEVNAEALVDDFPPLPEDVSTLATLASDDAQSGDYVTYTELVCSPATNWQPSMLTRTVQLVEKDQDAGAWKVKLAVRDLPPKEYDEDGNRVYGKFEMAEMSDDEEDAEEDERIKVMAFAELADARLLKRAEAEESTTVTGAEADAEGQ